MSLIVHNLILSCETLANQALKLNHSYLSLLKLYREFSFTLEVLQELEKSGESPLKVLQAMFKEQTNLQSKFKDLVEIIAQTQAQLSNAPETEKLQAIAHDCRLMQDFIESIDIKELQQMFIQLSY